MKTFIETADSRETSKEIQWRRSCVKWWRQRRGQSGDLGEELTEAEMFAIRGERKLRKTACTTHPPGMRW